MNEICALIEETQESSLVHSAIGVHSGEMVL